jgi:predicted AAA+ superfamily ATPase
MAFADYGYISLESPDNRNFAEADPKGFLNGLSKKTIIDEIQRVPELLSYIQVLVDETEMKGQFILTGSHQLQLRQEITQSLAGRTALLTLLPFALEEVKSGSTQLSNQELILKGFFPRIWKDNLNPTRAYQNYYKTYVERDLRQLINLKNFMLFEKFIKLLAGRTGQILNLNSLSNEVGVSSNTLKEWLSILEASFVVFQLKPYFENFGKRVIKSPKIYFTDSGLLCYLLGIEEVKQLVRDPLSGAIFENFVILEFFKARYNQGLDSNFYFFRDSNGREIDLLQKKGSQFDIFEIKSAETFQKNFIKNLKYFENLTGKVRKSYLVYSGNTQLRSEATVLNFRELSQIFS